MPNGRVVQLKNFILGLAVVMLASQAARASCREDALDAAKACLTEDLEAGMQGGDSEEAQRLLGEMAATGEMIKNGVIERQGDLYKKLAVQSKRGSLLAAIKSQACKRAHETCSKSCSSDDREPQAQQAVQLCRSIGEKNVKLAEQQAGHLLENMQTNERGHKGTATLIERQEGRTGGSPCDDRDCSGQNVGASSSGSSGGRPAEQQLAVNNEFLNDEGGESFRFDGRFETVSNSSGTNDSTSNPSLYGGGSSSEVGAGQGVKGAAVRLRSIASETASGGAALSFRAPSAGEIAPSEMASSSEIGGGPARAIKKSFGVIKGVMNSFAAKVNSWFAPPEEETPRKQVVIKRAQPKRVAARMAEEAQSVVKTDGVTSSTGPSLFEKIHRQYKSQEANLAD